MYVIANYLTNYLKVKVHGLFKRTGVVLFNRGDKRITNVFRLAGKPSFESGSHTVEARR